MDILRTEHLVRNYQLDDGGKAEVLKGLDFSVSQGEFVGIMGRSGCGKTTLLKVLGLIDAATEGKVYFKEKDTHSLRGDALSDIRRRNIGFVFQDFYLMDSLTVQENIILPLLLEKEKPAKARKRAKKYATHFKIDDLLNKNPYELSGGEKQRVAICRALINNPDLILADEPTGNLDSKSGDTVIDLLSRINQEFGKTIVMVTHDPKMASYCGRLILLKDGIIQKDITRTTVQRKFYQEVLTQMETL